MSTISLPRSNIQFETIFWHPHACEAVASPMASAPLAKALAIMASLALATADVVTPLYKDPSQSVAARTTDLLSRMTLDEKIAQTLQPWSVYPSSAWW
jgi:hypothetical protein